VMTIFEDGAPTMPPAEKRDFQRILAELYGCESTYEGCATVAARWGHENGRDGVINLFALVGHATAARCYAWRQHDSVKWRYVTVLEIPPVDSAETAVRAAMAAKTTSRESDPGVTLGGRDEDAKTA